MAVVVIIKEMSYLVVEQFDALDCPFSNLYL